MTWFCRLRTHSLQGDLVNLCTDLVHINFLDGLSKEIVVSLSFFFFFLAALFIAVCGLLSCSEACGILVPQSGIELTSPALEGGLLTT